MNKLVLVSIILFACSMVLWMQNSGQERSEIQIVENSSNENKEARKAEDTVNYDKLSFHKHPETSTKNTQTSPELALGKVDDINNNEILNLPADFALPDHTGFEINAALTAGFSEEGAKAISSNSPADMLSIEDMPAPIRDEIKENLNFIKENGYEEVSDTDSHEIVNIVNYLISSSRTIENITFKPSTIPEYIETNYNYVGYSYPNSIQAQSSETNSNDTVRRVYQNINKNNLLVLEESSLNSGGATLLKEYVNDSVGKYPATYILKKTDHGETYATLNWITDNSVYTLYQVGNIDSTTQLDLNKAANSISNQNKTSSDNNAPAVDESSTPSISFTFAKGIELTT